MVADPATDEILAVERSNWPPVEKMTNRFGTKPTARSLVKLNPEHRERRVQVLVISDFYIGLVWKLEGVEIPSAPTTVYNDGKKGS